jgi:hypothetical protein
MIVTQAAWALSNDTADDRRHDDGAMAAGAAGLERLHAAAKRHLHDLVEIVSQFRSSSAGGRERARSVENRWDVYPQVE